MAATKLSDIFGDENSKKPSQQEIQPRQQAQGPEEVFKPWYVLYVLPTTKDGKPCRGSSQAMRYYQTLHRYIRLINIKDLPANKIPKWLSGAPTLVDLKTSRMYQGTLAIDHLYHAALNVQGQEMGNGQANANGNGHAPSSQKRLQPIQNNVQRADRSDKPVNLPPPSFASPAGMKSASSIQTNKSGFVDEQDFSPMPGPSPEQSHMFRNANANGHGASHSGASGVQNQQAKDLDPALGLVKPKSGGSLADDFDSGNSQQQKSPATIDLKKYGGGSKKIGNDQLEAYMAMRKKQEDKR